MKENKENTFALYTCIQLLLIINEKYRSKCTKLTTFHFFFNLFLKNIREKYSVEIL